MSTSELLPYLRRAIAKSPEIYTHVVGIYQHSNAIYAIVTTDEGGTLELVALSDADEAEITAIAALLSPEGTEALFDGAVLRGILTFAAKNPEFAALLWKLLSGLGS